MHIDSRSDITNASHILSIPFVLYGKVSTDIHLLAKLCLAWSTWRCLHSSNLIVKDICVYGEDLPCNLIAKPTCVTLVQSLAPVYQLQCLPITRKHNETCWKSFRISVWYHSQNTWFPGPIRFVRSPERQYLVAGYTGWVNCQATGMHVPEIWWNFQGCNVVSKLYVVEGLLLSTINSNSSTRFTQHLHMQ